MHTGVEVRGGRGEGGGGRGEGGGGRKEGGGEEVNYVIII